MNTYDIVRTDAEVRTVMDWAREGQQRGTRHRAMTYEDGLIEMFDWLTDPEADPIIE